MVTLKDIPKTVGEAFAMDQARISEVQEAVGKRTEERMRLMRDLASKHDDFEKQWEIAFLSLPGITLNDICGASSLIREFYGVQPIATAEKVEDEMLLIFEVPTAPEDRADFNERLGELLRILHEQFPAIMEHSAVAIKSKR